MSWVDAVISEATVLTSVFTPRPGVEDDGPSAAVAAAPSSKEDVNVEMSPPSVADNTPFVKTLTEIINAAYSEAWANIYKPGYLRTTTENLAGLIRAGELAIASIPSPTMSSPPSTLTWSYRRPVGCVCIQQLSSTLGRVGMLALDLSYRGGGLGQNLMGLTPAFFQLSDSNTDISILFAEAESRKRGLDTMQLEMLVPTSFEHAFKVRLQKWYERMGYEFVELGDFRQEYPHMASLLAGPMEFRVFRKSLE